MAQVHELLVNGRRHAVDVDVNEPLLAVLREELGLTGAKIGCGEGECGACTVLVDGVVTRACITPVGSVAGQPVLTIEGLAAPDGNLHPLQQAFLDEQALQCGYCTGGMILASVALLSQNLNPSEDEIIHHLNGNLCRCGTYSRILRAVQRAAAEMRAAAVVGVRT
jgi:aerobic-type carbon monoxide dehydrogenase small subunit (CoxS/CutS family)